VRLACASLTDLTRLWLLRDAAAPASTGVPLTARYVLSETAGGWAATEMAATEMGEPSPPPEPQPLAANWRAVLVQAAARHAGEQIALCAPARLLELAAREALGLPHFALDPGARNVVLDWPARPAAHLRCAFIGLDLDWSPPPPPKSVARFPGGPGSAATSRS